MGNRKPYLVRFGRTDDSANKTLFIRGKREALDVANSICYVMFYRHDFKHAECRADKLVEQDGFYIEFITPFSDKNHAQN